MILEPGFENIDLHPRVMCKGCDYKLNETISSFKYPAMAKEATPTYCSSKGGEADSTCFEKFLYSILYRDMVFFQKWTLPLIYKTECRTCHDLFMKNLMERLGKKDDSSNPDTSEQV